MRLEGRNDDVLCLRRTRTGNPCVAASEALRELLSGYGVMELEIFLSEEPPKQHPISGKFKHVINEP